MNRPSSTTPWVLSDCRLIVDCAEQRSGGDMARRLGELFPGHVEKSALNEPERNIPTSVAPRHASDTTCGQIHRAARAHKILGDLASGLRASHNQHRPSGEFSRIAVLGGVKLPKVWRKRSGDGWTARQVQISARNHDISRL